MSRKYYTLSFLVILALATLWVLVVSVLKMGLTGSLIQTGGVLIFVILILEIIRMIKSLRR